MCCLNARLARSAAMHTQMSPLPACHTLIHDETAFRPQGKAFHLLNFSPRLLLRLPKEGHGCAHALYYTLWYKCVMHHALALGA